MNEHDVRRIAAGCVARELREHKLRVRRLREEQGRTARATKAAVARLDELREAYERLIGEQSKERLAASFLSSLIHELDEGDEQAAATTIRLARGWLHDRRDGEEPSGS